MLIVNKLNKSGKPLNELAKNGNSVNKIYRNGEVVFQNVTVTKVTAITLDNLVWTTNIPWSGGTATKDNCTYVVTADYDNGNRVDITTLTPNEGLWVEGAKTVSASTNTSRHSVGSLSLDITYFPEFTATTPVYTATTAITAYQEAYEEPTPTVTGSSIIIGTVSGGTIGLGTGCEANFNGSLTVSGSEVCTLTNSGNNIIVNGYGQFGWSSISYDEAKAVEFGYDWGGNYQYINSCNLSLIITDGVNTVNGVIQKGSQSVTVDLTPFWTNDTTEHKITVTINATID